MSNTITSLINPNIIYDYKSKLNKIDQNYSSKVYKISIGEKKVNIVLGRTIFRKGNPKSTFYYNIYILLDAKAVEKIGLFEVEYSTYIFNELYEGKILDVKKLGYPLFYPDQFKRYFPDSKLSIFNKKYQEEIVIKPKKGLDESELHDMDELDEMDEVDSAPNNPAVKNLIKRDVIDDKLEEISQDDTSEQSDLVEETFNDYEKMQKEYVKRNEDNWIQRKMKNRNYRIIDNGDDETSLFEVVNKALNREEYSTEILRNLLVDFIDQKDFIRYKKLYAKLKEQKETLEKKMKEIKTPDERPPGGENLFLKLKKQNSKSNDANKLKEEFKNKSEFIEKLKFMEKVNTLEDLKEVIKTDEYWGDNFAISLLEKVLKEEKIKIIVLLEDMVKESDDNKIVQCNNYNMLDLTSQKTNAPVNYIILSLSETRYRLVTYKNRNLLKFTHLPYGLKRNLINNCTNNLS